jgi:hypothetical protein
VCSEDRADRSSFEGASVFASDPVSRARHPCSPPCILHDRAVSSGVSCGLPQWHNPAVASIDDFYMLVPRRTRAALSARLAQLCANTWKHDG